MIKYIFCINTGRSGSNTLYEIFKCVPECQSNHEAKPILNSVIQRNYLNGRKTQMKEAVKEKIGKIKSSNSEIYFESNHSFIKGFGWEIVHLLPQSEIGVIILKRDPQKIAESLQRINCSPFNVIGSDWIITPSFNRRNRLSNWEIIQFYFFKAMFWLYYQKYKFFKKNDFKQSLPNIIKNKELFYLKWYIGETEILTNDFKKDFPAIKYFELSTEDLNSVEKIHEMLLYFGIKNLKNVGKAIGKKYNTKSFNE